MRRTAYLFMMIFLCLASTVLLSDVVSWALKGPGLNEASVRHAWETFPNQRNRVAVSRAYPYMACFEKAAREHRVPLALLLAVARGESDFNPGAVSSKGCVGIMQIQWPDTAKDLGIFRRSDLLDPCINIDAGARYLAQLLKRFRGDYYLAVAGYNHGPNGVSPNTVPPGAVWYAAYIHRHLQWVLSGPFDRKGRMLILAFSSYKRAAGFASYLEDRLAGVPVEVFKSRKYTYDVCITYKTSGERKKYWRRITEKTGIQPPEGGSS